MSEKKYLPENSVSQKTARRKASLIQKLLPTQFSIDCASDEEVWTNLGPDTAIVKLNVYKLKDSSVGFYHTGIEFRNLEYTYCCGIGICYHKPKHCHFATWLGTIQLGCIEIDMNSFQNILKDMDQFGGFSYSDYDVMDRSCNTFTYELSKRLHLSTKYPMGILHQSKLGEFLAPVVHALDVLAASSGFGSGCLGCKNDENTPSCIRKNSAVFKRHHSNLSIIMNPEAKRNDPPPLRKRKSMRFFNFFTTSMGSQTSKSNIAEPGVDEDFKLTKLQNIHESD